MGGGASNVIEKRDSSLKGLLVNQSSVGSKIGGQQNTFGNNAEDSGFVENHKPAEGAISPKIQKKIEIV